MLVVSRVTIHRLAICVLWAVGALPPAAVWAEPSDNCRDAPLIENVPFSEISQTGTATTAADDPLQQCTGSGAHQNSASVWYRFTPSCQGLLKVSTCGSGYDTIVSVYSGSCGALTEIACSDDVCGYQSEVNGVRIAPGVPLLIEVTAYHGQGGGHLQFLLDFECCTPPPLASNPSPAADAVGVPIDAQLAWGSAVPTSVRGPAPSVIYGADNRRDEYEITDPALLAAGDATVVLFSRLDLIDNGNGSYSIPATTLQQHRGVCPEEPFANQPDPGKCSGFLVGPDVLATAGHCIRNQAACDDTVAVFGFVMMDAQTPVLTFPESQVYQCSEIIGRQQDGADWALLRLDRPVLDHTPLRVRHTGKIPADEPLLAIGHPLGLPRKYADGAGVRDNSNLNFFVANLDTYSGSSGSAVLSARTLRVEGILVRGETDLVNKGGCYVSKTCTDTGCRGEDVTRAPVFAHLLPFLEYDVWFGECDKGLEMISEAGLVETCNPGLMRPRTRYCWQVVMHNSCDRMPGPMWSFTTAAPAAPGDFDADGDVDQTDFAHLQACYTGPGIAVVNPACDDARLDYDLDIDLNDLAILEACMSGSKVPANPDCANY